MIINTGMRTDIPAFYAEWFINRIKAMCITTNALNNLKRKNNGAFGDDQNHLSVCNKEVK